MRFISGTVIALFICWPVMVQAQQKLADEIAVSRTIIAKLDSATQKDPPPNFASEILVRIHKEATTFLEAADATSEELRQGQPPNALSLLSIYTQFIDLYDEYDSLVTFTSKRIELETVRLATAKEYTDAKALLEAVTLYEVSQLNDVAQGCKPTRPKR